VGTEGSVGSEGSVGTEGTAGSAGSAGMADDALALHLLNVLARFVTGSTERQFGAASAGAIPLLLRTLERARAGECVELACSTVVALSALVQGNDVLNTMLQRLHERQGSKA
jgi:hypothetical protein